MKLAEIILENERNQKSAENSKLVRTRLKELVYAFPKQTLEILHKTGVPIGVALPPPILFAVVIKHLGSNSQLREAIAKMLIEADGYSSANGEVWQMIGGAVTAVGSVLSGIGRGQKDQSDTDSEKQAQIIQQQLDNERAKSTRVMWITIGISVVVITAIFLGVRAYLKSKSASKATVKPTVTTNFQPAS